MARQKEAVAVVAHPDDETLWAGGAILANTGFTWTVVSLCRRSDPDRSGRFFRALERLDAKGAMADLDDGPDQWPLDPVLVENTVLSLLPGTDCDLLVTHSPFGEYTRHRRHEETSRAVTSLWEGERLAVGELWLFAYEDGHRQYHPRSVERAHVRMKLDETLWKKKLDIIQNTYGFAPDSWEANTTPRTEAFWRFYDVQAFRAWFEQEQEIVRGPSK